MTSRPGKPGVSAARRTAMDILQRVETERAFASFLVAAIPESALKREDRALVRELVLGVLRWRKALDSFIERYAGRSPSGLDLQVLNALRLGIYQLRHLSRIPASAAVNESVNLVRRARLASATGLVNAVLRRAARNLTDSPGDDIADPLERLSIQVSHPVWMLARWTRDFGPPGTHSLGLANNQAPRTAFRVNNLLAPPDQTLARIQREGVSFNASPVVPGAFIAEKGAALAATAAVREGLIYIQDEASQLVSLVLRPEPGQRVLDLCAAPGSKSSHIAALTGGEARITACDLHSHRLATLASICRRLGASSVDAVALDATRELPFTGPAAMFDRVLVDAPCSGTGTLRENPEIKWRLTPADIPRLAETQLSLLQRGAEALEVGGRLVYSTCSLEVEENEGVIHQFLQQEAAFEIVKPDVHPDLITADGFVRTFPHRHGSDGFFAALLQRR